MKLKNFSYKKHSVQLESGKWHNADKEIDMNELDKETDYDITTDENDVIQTIVPVVREEETHGNSEPVAATNGRELGMRRMSALKSAACVHAAKIQAKPESAITGDAVIQTAKLFEAYIGRG